MHKLKRFTARILMVIMLSVSISASFGGLSYTTVQAAVKAPTVAEAKKTLYAGYDTYIITFKNKASKSAITFKSSNTTVASVSKNGTVTPKVSGVATITATVKQNGKTYTLKVTIAVKNPSVEMTLSTKYLNAGETFLFKAKTTGSKSKVEWSVSDEEIATINAGGKLTAVAPGEVTVYANAGGLQTSCAVVVGSNRLGTFTKNLTLYEEQTIYITISEPVEDDTYYVDTLSTTKDIIEFDCAEQEIADLMPITVTPVTAGSDTLIITTDETADQLHINVTVVEKPTDREELEPTEIFKKCNPAMVEITATSLLGSKSLGSGFFIDNNSVVTNYHVIEGAEKLVVKAYDGEEYEIETILGYNEDIDLAVLKTDLENVSLVLSHDKVATGETVYALGSPFGLTGTLSGGMVTTASREIDGVDCIQIDAAISSGNSGGPLINIFGEVVGVNTMYLQGGQNLNFSVNINELYKVNTNRPMKVEDFKRTIYEDPAVSQNPDICQEVPPYTEVIGSLTADEDGDCYYIEVNSPIHLYGVIKSDNMEDMAVTWVQIYNYNWDEFATAQESDELPIQGINDAYLAPDDYFIVLYLPDDYVGEDVPYTFMLGYEDVY